MKIAKEHKILINDYEKLRMDAFFCENQDHLKSEIERLVNDGFDRFIVGLKELFDVAAAEAIQQCKASHPEIEYITITYKDQFKGGSPSFRQRANDVMRSADGMMLTSREFHNKAFYFPHPYLTDTLKLSVVYSNPLGDGGTMYAYSSKEIGAIPLLDSFDELNSDSPFCK